MRWEKIPATGDVPGGRASHSSAAFQEHLYIFGGIGPDGPLDTTYKYHTGREAALSGARVDARHWSYTAAGLNALNCFNSWCHCVLFKAVTVSLHCRKAALDTPAV